MRFDQAIGNAVPVPRFFAKLAFCGLLLLALILGNSGCVGTERIARLEGEVSGLKTGVTQVRTEAAQALGEAKQGRVEAAQALGEAKQGRTEAAQARAEVGQAKSGLAGLQTVVSEQGTKIDGLQEFRKSTEKDIPELKRGVRRALQGDEPAGTAQAAPDTSALVAGPAAPAPKAGLAASECTEVENVGVACTNPNVAQLRSMKREKRALGDITAFGPNQAAVDTAWKVFVRSAEAAEFDLSGITLPSDANRAIVDGRRSITAIKVQFGDLPDEVKKLRATPKLATP